jgi:hypothetical protein
VSDGFGPDVAVGAAAGVEPEPALATAGDAFEPADDSRPAASSASNIFVDVGAVDDGAELRGGSKADARGDSVTDACGGSAAAELDDATAESSAATSSPACPLNHASISATSGRSCG